jgi:hypothetical protein
MYMYACMYTHDYSHQAYMGVEMRKSRYVCVYFYVHTDKQQEKVLCQPLSHKQEYMHTCIHTYILHTYTHTYAQTRNSRLPLQILCEPLLTNMRTCTHAYILHAYIHTYIHKETSSPNIVRACSHKHAYMHTCMHIYILHAYIHTHRQATRDFLSKYCASMFSQTCIHAHMYTYIHTTYIHTHTHTCTQTSNSRLPLQILCEPVLTNIHTCTSTCMQACIHSQVHTYIHTHTYTHTHRQATRDFLSKYCASLFSQACTPPTLQSVLSSMNMSSDSLNALLTAKNYTSGAKYHKHGTSREKNRAKNSEKTTLGVYHHVYGVRNTMRVHA